MSCHSGGQTLNTSFSAKPLLCHACRLLKDGAHIIDRASMATRLSDSYDAKWTLGVEGKLAIEGHWQMSSLELCCKHFTPLVSVNW